MAADHRSKSAPPKGHKLARLPDNVKVSKRPLMHGPIVSPYAGKQQPKVMYLSSKTPFMSAFKHIKQLLKHVEKRETERDLAKAKRDSRRGEGGRTVSVQLDDSSEPVFVKATGKAIEKALQLALFLQQQQDLRVRVKTGSIDAIDDLVIKPDQSRGVMEVTAEGMELDQPTMAPPQVDVDDLPEARIRHASMIELEVTLRR